MITTRTIRLTLAALLGIVLAPNLGAQTSPAEGDWLGTLRIQSMSLRMVFHISPAPEGRWNATMDSPDQGANGLPVDSVRIDGNELFLGSSMVRGTYTGTLQPGDSTIEGSWSQSGMTFPLRLSKIFAEVVVNRPQEPKPPFPYRTEDVTFRNGTDGVDLAGTLSIPAGSGPFPAVALVSGSGPQDRDETVFNHRPFLVLADHLARAGVAVLRYDDRGVGRSTGSFSAATTVDLSRDAEAAVEYLRTRSEVDPMRVGLLGHSEGGIIAPMVAVRTNDLDFIVMLAGPSIPGAEIILMQDSLISRASGVSLDRIAVSLQTNRAIFRLLSGTDDTTGLRPKIIAILRDGVRRSGDTTTPSADLESGFQRTTTQLLLPWTRFFLRYDPSPALTEVACPVLALYGEKDLQVPARINARNAERAFAEVKHTRTTVRILDGLNHMFQPAETGSPSEYTGIETTIAPEALQIISAWILNETLRH